MKERVLLTILLLFFLSGCTQTRVYKKDFSFVAKHLSKRWRVDLSDTDKVTRMPYSIIPGGRRTEWRARGGSLISDTVFTKFKTGYMLGVEEYAPGQRIQCRFDRIMSPADVKITVERVSHTETKVIADFPRSSYGKKFLDEMEREMREREEMTKQGAQAPPEE